jgi:hypothetical protein
MTTKQEGWKLVPVEPTREMLLAGWQEGSLNTQELAAHYRAMLAASPPIAAPSQSADQPASGTYTNEECQAETIRLQDNELDARAARVRDLEDLLEEARVYVRFMEVDGLDDRIDALLGKK